MPAYRLSGYPAATAVSVRAALRNGVGRSALSVARVAAPGAAPGAAPELWGARAHGASLSANPLDVSAWTLDGATETAMAAASPYAAPRLIASSLLYGRKNTTTSVLTAGLNYPFAVMVRAGTGNAARIVIREAASGGEARMLTTGFATVTASYSATSIGTISGAAVEALADGFVRLSGVFTPSITTTYSIGVGPNTSVAGDVALYGGALAAPSGGGPAPDPEAVPAPFAPEQWQLLDAATGGALTVRILELPASNPPLTAIGYRLNGSTTTITFPAIAPGDYQIGGLTNGVAASALLRSANALGGASSEAKTATPTAASAPSPGPADDWAYGNAVYEAKQKLPLVGGQVIALGGTTLSSSSGTESYINGIRLFNGDGSMWHASREGNLSYAPNGAHDALNPGEYTDVSVTWRRTGDVSNRTFTLRVFGSAVVGSDLARGVTPGASMTLLSSVAAGDVLEVAFTVTGAAVTPALGGTAGASAPAGRRDVQYLRHTGATTALTFSGGGTVSNVIARVVQTPGDAAAIRRLKASRSGTTLTLDWRTMPRAGFPSTAGWTEAGGTPAAPEVRNRAASAVGFHTATGSWTQWKFFNAAATRAFIHDAVITGVNSVIKLRSGFTNILVYDVEGYGPVYSLKDGGGNLIAGSGLPDRGQFINPLENVSSWPEQGDLRVYDTIFDRKLLTGNNEAADNDNYFMNYIRAIYYMNGDWRNTGDALSDTKGFGWFHCMTYGQSQRGIRVWFRSNTFGRTRLDGPYSQADVNISHRSGAIVAWLCDAPGGARIRSNADVTKSLTLSAFGYVADARQMMVAKTKPAFPPECDYAATDFEFEQSLNGGASWSALSVTRTGPNDCWGATRRTVTGVSTSVTHVRCRAKWGAKVGAWTQAAVTV